MNITPTDFIRERKSTSKDLEVDIIPPIPRLPTDFNWKHKYNIKESEFLASVLLQVFPTPVKLRDYQERDVVKQLALVLQHEQGCQLLAPTRTGKTYNTAAFIYILGKSGYFQAATPAGHLPLFEVIIITKATIVKQTQRVLKRFGFLHKDAVARIYITNYDTLRSSLGELFLKWNITSIRGEEVIEPAWFIKTAPCLICCDENQSLRNENSLQTKCIRAWFNLQHTQRIFTLFTSASPWTRPSESRAVVVGCGVRISDISGNWFKVSDVQWPGFVQSISDGKPYEYSPAAMKKLREAMNHWIVESEGIKYTHKSICKHLMLDFPNQESFDRYQKAYEEYLEVMNSVNPDFEEHWYHRVFVAQMKFRRAAEQEHSPIAAQSAKDLCEKTSSSILIGFAFKDSLQICYDELLRLGVEPSKIGVLTGEVSMVNRQKVIDAFQITETIHYLLVTNQTGGVGLSLHHNSEDNNKRPRKVLVTLVWSIIDMLQFLGRCHGPNSDSTTYQFSLWFKGTIEEEVKNRLTLKHKSLSQLMTSREQVTDLFIPDQIRDKFSEETRKQKSLRSDNSIDEVDDEVIDIDCQLLAENTEIEE